jgi:rhomboid protease GluP
MNEGSPGPADFPLDSGYVPPDPDEPPPVELWRAVGDVPPWGTALLLLAWAGVFAWFAIRQEFGNVSAYAAWGANIVGSDARDTAWRLLAATFLHDGPAHVFFNAISMLIFGPAVERLFARPGFWIVYAIGGAAASLGSLAWRASQHVPGLSLSVGASGAIFALGGALIVCAARLRHRLAPGRARALGAALMFLLAQGLVAGFARHGTDNAAHVAGFLAGALAGAILPISERLGGRRAGMLVRALGTLAALALALALALGVRGGLAYG